MTEERSRGELVVPATILGSWRDARIALTRLTEAPLDRWSRLFARYRGRGAAITREVLELGFTDLGLIDVLIALPYSRSPDRAVARLGFRPDGEVDYGGVAFRRYRLTRAAWAEALDRPV